MKTIPSILLYFLFVLMLFACKKESTEASIIEYGKVADIDGNEYITVKIGNQWWMAENLRVSKFNDGTDINYLDIAAPDSLWATSTSPAYTLINTESGHLYNGFAIQNEKNIAPEGWHIPSDQEWKTLESTLQINAPELEQTGWRGAHSGDQLASKYAMGWPEGGILFGTNEFGFNAIPGGCRIADGRTNISNNTAFWWTRSPEGNQMWYRYMDSNQNQIFRQHTHVQYGMSVRCVKD